MWEPSSISRALLLPFYPDNFSRTPRKRYAYSFRFCHQNRHAPHFLAYLTRNNLECNFIINTRVERERDIFYRSSYPFSACNLLFKVTYKDIKMEDYRKEWFFIITSYTLARVSLMIIIIMICFSVFPPLSSRIPENPVVSQYKLRVSSSVSR